VSPLGRLAAPSDQAKQRESAREENEAPAKALAKLTAVSEKQSSGKFQRH